MMDFRKQAYFRQRSLIRTSSAVGTSDVTFPRRGLPRMTSRTNPPNILTASSVYCLWSYRIAVFLIIPLFQKMRSQRCQTISVIGLSITAQRAPCIQRSSIVYRNMPLVTAPADPPSSKIRTCKNSFGRNWSVLLIMPFLGYLRKLVFQRFLWVFQSSQRQLPVSSKNRRLGPLYTAPVLCFLLRTHLTDLICLQIAAV